MKKADVFLGMMVVGLLSAASMGLTVTAASDNSFEVVGPSATFTSWALDGGATRGGDSGVTFETYSSAYTNGTTISGSNASSGSAWLTIPFTFSKPLQSASISYNSEVSGYGNNWGGCLVYVIVDGVETRIYQHSSPDYVTTSGMNPSDVYYNYNGSVPSDGGIFCTSTDITTLVHGKTSFSIKFVSSRGWSQWVYSGGVFMASDAAASDFRMTGTVAPNSLMVTPDSNGAFSVTGPASDFTDWALSVGATRGGDEGATFDTYTTAYTNNTTISGSNTPSKSAWLTIPFTFPEPVTSASISYNSEVSGYGNNWGGSVIYVVVDGVEKRVYQHSSPDYVTTSGMDPAEVYYNYNGVAPSGGGIFCTSTDITDLVRGETSFSIKFQSTLGWSQWLYSGGVLMASDAASPDFQLAGTVVTETGLTVAPDSTGAFSVTGPADDFTDWALSYGATRGGEDGATFETYSNAYTNGTIISGSNTASRSAWLTVPFKADQPFDQVALSFCSQIMPYGNNWGSCIVYVVVDGVEKTVYMHGSPDYIYTAGMSPSDVYYNYGGTAPMGGGVFVASTDISNLVRGKTSFSVKFLSSLGWSQWVYSGGVFMASNVISPDFQVTGSVLMDGLPATSTAFDVPAIGPITADGNLSDWSASTLWSQPYVTWNVPWNQTALTSTTKAKFAWNDADNLLYVAIQTDEHSVRSGGHAVVGISNRIDGVATSGMGATQLCFDLNPDGTVQIRNEIALYNGVGGVEGVQAGCSQSNGVWTYEIAIPFWSNWADTSLGRIALSGNDVVYVYACMESVFQSANGTDMTYLGNPGFAYAGGFHHGAALTLKPAAVVQIPGDANGDRKVDVSDLGILAANYGITGGATWDKGDFNNDGKVDVSDLGILAANYGTGTGAVLDFNADAKALGLSAEAKEETPTAATFGCGSIGLPLIAGLALMGLMLVKLEE